jgi:hypothetical protein
VRQLLILPILVAVAAPAFAQVDPKVASQCKEARDFLGCVKAFTSPATAPGDELDGLRGAMKQVAGRLSAGTNLRDSTSTFQPVIDALALVETSHSNSLAVQQAQLASKLFGVMQTAWDLQIKSKSYELSQYLKGEDVYACEVLKQSADAFDAAYGSPVINWQYKKGVFGISTCRVSYGRLPLDSMYPVVIRVLREGSISPNEIAARDAEEKERLSKLQRERELAALGPWKRYLEENPSIKKWVEANPAAAEKEKEKFLKKYAKENPSSKPTIYENVFGK